jgi:hypothetical protein
MMSVLDSASLCAERGLHTIPVWTATNGVCNCTRGAECISPGKHPAIDAWQTSATTDLHVIRDWFAGGRYNIGVVCGASNVVVIDIDPRNGGDVTFAALVNDLGPLPDTLTADSGGGGTHFVFRRPQGELVSKLGQGVDLLRDSRQFLVEPSLHPSGKRYQWRTGHAPDEIAIAELPSAWQQRLHPRIAPRPTAPPRHRADDSDRVKRARAYLAKIPGAVSGDAGHTATFNAVAAVMIGFDLSEQDALNIIAADYNPRCDPPWSERELEHKIRSVAQRCERERGYLLVDRPRSGTSQPAAPASPPSAPPSSDWQSRLLFNAEQRPRRAYHNTAVFVRDHPEFANRWSYDEMTGAPYVDGKPMDPEMVHYIRAQADCRLGYTPSAADVEAAIVAAAKEQSFHPIRQYLRSLDWDGTPRLHAMANDYLSSDSPLHASMVHKFMIGAAARVLWPGCKLDTALMLVGPQGLKKSTFFSILGGRWHSDTYIDITNKDAALQLHGSWIYELSELENVVTGARESRLKAWITSTHDTYRPPYGKAAERRARSAAICGTTNRKQFLTDDSGSRRFWIVPVGCEVPVELLAELRDQLWAEAVCAAESGETWWFGNTVDESAREVANRDFADDDDPWTGAVAAWVERPSVAMSATSVTEILTLALDVKLERQDRGSQMRVARILQRLGWERYRSSTVGRPWGYRRRSLPGVE